LQHSDSIIAKDLQLLDTPTEINTPDAQSRIEEPVTAKFAHDAAVTFGHFPKGE
jgi:hypothetical protein